MSRRESLIRHSLIIEKLRNKPANFSEIEEHLTRQSALQDYNFSVSKRTFQRDLNDIRSIYDVDIQYDASRQVYFIADDNEKQQRSERILEASHTLNVLNMTDPLADYIHFESRKPQGTENLYGLLHALRNKLLVKFTYQKFWDDEASERIAEPYALKEFKNRWYLIAKDPKDVQIKTFALDRMNEFEITKKRFSFPENFDVREMFRYSFGIIAPNGEPPQEIILSFNNFQGKYIKSLPLHHSQKTLLDNEDELRISLQLCITHDFIMELLSYADNMKVLKPETLQAEICTLNKKAAEQY